MADNDQFTFDDDDGFPETLLGKPEQPPKSGPSDGEDFFDDDLSAAFSDGEHSADNPEQEAPQPKGKGGGSSRTKLLLIVLLLVVAGGGGAYFFMDMDGSTPSVPTAPVPVKPAAKAVAVPPKPAQPAAVPVNAEPAKTTVAVAVPVPVPPAPAQKVEPPVTPVAPAAQPAVTVTPPPAAVAKPAVQEAAEKTAPAQAKQPAAQVAAPAPEKPPVPAVKTTPVETATAVPATPKTLATVVEAPTPPSVTEKPAASAKQVENGAFALDAGSYLLESNRDMLVAKIKKLGYEPLITPVDATLDMTRLRVGTYSKDEVQDALSLARSIEPGSYSSPAGDRYVIYAGTFLQSGNVDSLSKKFLKEGIKVYAEPVQVVRTLSRIRFGSFATKDDADAAARVVADAGLKTDVVKSK